MKAIKAIKIIKRLITSVELVYKTNPLTDKEPHPETDALTLAISALEKQEQDRWIPVTERLPEKDGECRVTVKTEFGKYVGDCFWNKGEKQFENWNAYLDCYVKVSDVTAWKPIEEPYMEEDNDKS